MAALFKPKAPVIPDAPKPVTRDETLLSLDDRLRLLRRQGRDANILTRRRALGSTVVGGSAAVGTSSAGSTSSFGGTSFGGASAPATAGPNRGGGPGGGVIA